MAEINEFDDQLKDALSNLGNDISPRDWDSFAEKLDASNGIASFDDLIRDRMDALEVNADANYWDVLESKIDQELNTPEISDEALDQLATNNLSNLYIPYNPTHWTLLSHRLEEEFNVRRKIFTYKAVEFSLMVLLLLTVVQFMPSYPSTSDKDIATETQSEIQSIFSPVETQSIAEANTSNISSTIVTSKSATISSEKINRSALFATTTTSKKEKIITSTSENLATTSSTNETNIPTTTIILNTPSEEISIVENKAVVTELENTLLILEDTHQPENQPALFLVNLPISTDLLDQTTDWSKIGQLKKFPKKVMVRLGAMTTANLNKVITPNSNRFKDNGYQQYRLGYGGGITLDLNYEKLTLSTGLIYQRINYYPQEDINIGGSFASGYQSRVFDAVNLNLLTIPMNLQFQMNNPDKKWKLHAITGASLNLLALNHYNVTVNNLSGNNNNGVGPRPIPGNTPDRSSPAELEREADIAGEGLFEGGSFEKNHYFTANFGVGVERFISPRWSLFIQPIYQHELFGKDLGINRDKIRTFSVQIGAKSTFK